MLQRWIERKKQRLAMAPSKSFNPTLYLVVRLSKLQLEEQPMFGQRNKMPLRLLDINSYLLNVQNRCTWQCVARAWLMVSGGLWKEACHVFETQ